ncbi:MAG: hypothetical protein AXA67_11660 [Methylothermaceae bacteria B42]|nr:MAG: hypothetical protein AXA67_11660 [Methylothermaceae bacteria B42]HHJ39188.1 metal-binding protein [Methylothermaceae bacterium]
MPARLPDLIDPLHCVDKGRHWQGEIPLSRMTRLATMIVNPEEKAVINLTFSREGKVAAVTGSVRATLALTCQRCLEPVFMTVDQPIQLGIVTSIEEGEALPEPYEPLLLEDEQIRLGSIVEDELILVIPNVPRHDDCRVLQVQTGSGEKGRRDNPFEVLANWKSKH